MKFQRICIIRVQRRKRSRSSIRFVTLSNAFKQDPMYQTETITLEIRFDRSQVRKRILATTIPTQAAVL